jgi:hypothetical protein
MALPRKQQGMTLMSFVVVASVVGFFLYIAAKLFPMYNEYYSVRSALKGIANESGVAQKDPAQIEDMFFKRMYINYASGNIKPEHVAIERAGGGLIIKVNYESRTSLVGNLDAVGRFSAEQSLSGSPP